MIGSKKVEDKSDECAIYVNQLTLKTNDLISDINSCRNECSFGGNLHYLVNDLKNKLNNLCVLMRKCRKNKTNIQIELNNFLSDLNRLGSKVRRLINENPECENVLNRVLRSLSELKGSVQMAIVAIIK